MESSKPGVKLTKIGLYNRIIDCGYRLTSSSRNITIKSKADYRVKISWKEGRDSVVEKAKPVLECTKNEKNRFTVGLVTPPASLGILYNNCIQLISRPVLVFSDGQQLILEEEIIDSKDFLDYNNKNIPSDEAILQEAGSSDENIRKNAARMLSKSTLPKTTLQPIIDLLIDDPDERVRANAIFSAGRLRYGEYTALLRNRFAKTISSIEASACLRTLLKTDSLTLTPLVLGRFDTSRMEMIVEVCCRWLQNNLPEQSFCRHVIGKLSAEAPFQVKLACLPLTEACDIKEAGDSVLAMLLSTELTDEDAYNIYHILVNLDEPSIAVKAYNLLQQQRPWLSPPEKTVSCHALLQVVVAYDYQPVLALLNELLQPDQSASTLQLTLQVLRERYSNGALDRMTKTLSDEKEQSFFEPLKPAILNLTTHPDERLRRQAFELYCKVAQPGDNPTREDLARNFLTRESPADQQAAVDLANSLKLENLAPDLCALLKKTTDAFYRSHLKNILKNALKYNCP
mgnify:CR=1 FL=1